MHGQYIVDKVNTAFNRMNKAIKRVVLNNPQKAIEADDANTLGGKTASEYREIKDEEILQDKYNHSVTPAQLGTYSKDEVDDKIGDAALGASFPLDNFGGGVTDEISIDIEDGYKIIFNGSVPACLGGVSTVFYNKVVDVRDFIGQGGTLNDAYLSFYIYLVKNSDKLDIEITTVKRDETEYCAYIGTGVVHVENGDWTLDRDNLIVMTIFRIGNVPVF